MVLGTLPTVIPPISRVTITDHVVLFEVVDLFKFAEVLLIECNELTLGELFVPNLDAKSTFRMLLTIFPPRKCRRPSSNLNLKHLFSTFRCLKNTLLVYTILVSLPNEVHGSDEIKVGVVSFNIVLLLSQPLHRIIKSLLIVYELW